MTLTAQDEELEPVTFEVELRGEARNGDIVHSLKFKLDFKNTEDSEAALGL